MQNNLIVVLKSKDTEMEAKINIAFSWITNSYIKLNDGTYLVATDMSLRTFYHKLLTQILDCNKDGLFIFQLPSNTELDDNDNSPEMAWWTFNGKKADWLNKHFGASIVFHDKEREDDEKIGEEAELEKEEI